jgi:hypothetical protein
MIYISFLLQVAVGSEKATGSGPNKKLAKRAAAENLLQAMGYLKPTPQPVKPALKAAVAAPTTTVCSGGGSACNAAPDEGSLDKSRKVSKGIIFLPIEQH